MSGSNTGGQLLLLLLLRGSLVLSDHRAHGDGRFRGLFPMVVVMLLLLLHLMMEVWRSGTMHAHGSVPRT